MRGGPNGWATRHAVTRIQDSELRRVKRASSAGNRCIDSGEADPGRFGNLREASSVIDLFHGHDLGHVVAQHVFDPVLQRGP